MTAISNLGLEEVGEYTAIDRYRQVLKGRSGTARDTLRRYDPNDKTIEWTPGLKYKIKDKIDALLVIRNLYLLSISHDVNPSFPFVHTIHDIENDRDNFKITPNELRAVKDEPLRGSRTIPFDIRFNPSTDILTIPPDRFNRKGEVRIETLEAAENELYKIYVRVLNDNPKYYKCWDAVWAIRRKWNIHHELNDAQKQRAVDTVTQIANKYMGPALQHRPEMKEREDTGDNTGSTTEQQQTLPTINWEASTKKKKKKKAKRKDDPPDTGSIPWMMPRHEELEKQKGPNAASQATEGGSGGSSAHNAYQAVYGDDFMDRELFNHQQHDYNQYRDIQYGIVGYDGHNIYPSHQSQGYQPFHDPTISMILFAIFAIIAVFGGVGIGYLIAKSRKRSSTIITTRDDGYKFRNDQDEDEDDIDHSL